MTALTEFLLARIAEDEEQASSRLRYWDRHILAECEAKRRILAAHPVVRGPRVLPVDTSRNNFGCSTCHCIDKVVADGLVEALGWCETLRALALPYAGHPEYQQEWAV